MSIFPLAFTATGKLKAHGNSQACFEFLNPNPQLEVGVLIISGSCAVGWMALEGQAALKADCQPE